MNRTDFIKYLNYPAELNLTTINELKELILEFPYCQSLHLLYIKNLHKENNFIYDKYLKIAAIYANDREKLYWFLNDLKAVTQENNISETKSLQPEETNINLAEPLVIPEKINEKKKLIDKFIENNPTINVQTKEFFNPVNLAMLSLTDDDEIVSDTLARIYLTQGNYSKAIRTYEKLSLLFPEKSSYFASQIEKIKSSYKSDFQ